MTSPFLLLHMLTEFLNFNYYYFSLFLRNSVYLKSSDSGVAVNVVSASQKCSGVAATENCSADLSVRYL